MLAVISPAKTLDFESQCPTKKHSEPDFLERSHQLVGKLSKLSRPKLAELMNISEKLATENHRRFQDWQIPFTPENARAALFAFKGDVYTGFELDEYKARDFDYAQKHLRILSGLYGLLRPLDLIQPYRLEMGTRLKVGRSTDLYAFWDTLIADALNAALAKSETSKSATPTLVNLASNEYFASVKKDRVDGRVITPSFKDLKNGKYKFLSFFAKKARGMMADYMIRERISDPEDLKNFDREGYTFNAELSKGDDWVFTRDEKPE
jgi:cytoplasmic iron level regulating protein YaaA (DUF328/UPF0246 family)